MNYSPRVLGTVELREACIDTGLELEDLHEELMVHEQYSPTSHVFHVWLGTVEEWTAEWESIKTSIRNAEQLMATLQREAERRTKLAQTRRLLATADLYNVIYLEDYFSKCRKKSNVMVR